MQPMVMKYGMDPAGKKLGAKLTPEIKAKFEKVGGEFGLPAAMLETPMEPWLVNMTIGAMAAMKMGLNPEMGADKQILKSARAAGKKVGELEGAEFQLKLFDTVPEKDQVKQLGQTLDQIPEMKPMLTKMLAHWNGGDAEGLGKMLNEGAAEMPDFYKLLLTDRNATWAEWIDKRMDQPGTVVRGGRRRPPCRQWQRPGHAREEGLQGHARQELSRQERARHEAAPASTQ
jgi:uncharacterized protein YbaP (TraB family)